MNLNDSKYNQFFLAKEMLQTATVVRNLDLKLIQDYAKYIKGSKVLLTGEGSSRIFPAKNTVANAHKLSYAQHIHTEGATQSLEYAHDDNTVFVASNSGKTKEGVRLIRALREQGHKSIVGVVSAAGTPIVTEADAGYVLTCQKEEAVAATKSVVEQALFNDIVFRTLNNAELPDLQKLGDLIEQVLTSQVPEAVIKPLIDSPILYWAGRNNGVAEELRLKTNEITRKKSDYLEGTYAAHGIEEVMHAHEAIILVDPFAAEEGKYQEVLAGGVGISLVSISNRQTSFPTFEIPAYAGFDTYLQLVAGWSLLVEVGLANSINLDKPVRARKVGNEFVA